MNTFKSCIPCVCTGSGRKRVCEEHNNILQTWKTISLSVVQQTITHSLRSWNQTKDWHFFTYLFKLVPTVAAQVGLGVLHLLLRCKTKHVSHQQWSFKLSPVASGCTIQHDSLTPSTDVLPWHKRHGGTRSSSKFIGMLYWSSIRSIFSKISHLPKWHKGIGSFTSENTHMLVLTRHSFSDKSFIWLNMKHSHSFTCEWLLLQEPLCHSFSQSFI